ncbi:DUF3068 domain-containing protein [Streptomonospora halophila]|uniref:DUF3068 domain-containing protein n=1 Tax=Streptomonospora halophila TaxID=427369 RepID=A0ABP9GWK9_9ACTN
MSGPAGGAVAESTGPQPAEAAPGRGPGVRGRGRRVSAVLARNARPVAVAAAAFLLTVALMLRFYVAGELERIPARIDLTMRLADDSAAYLDTGTWETVRGAEVERTTRVEGGFAPGNPDWTTWSMSTSTAARGTTLSHGDRRVIVDRDTGTAVNCCGEHVDGDRAVRQAGLVLLWPAGGGWKEYPFYDADIRAAPPMILDGRDRVGGLAVRRYVQRFDATQLPDSSSPVPARALGLEEPGTVQANRWLELERTYWVEPVTGRVVDAREVRRETLRPENGGGSRVLLDADLRMAEELVEARVREAEELRTLLRAVRTWLPVGLGTAGGLLFLAAAVRELRARRTAPAAEDGGGVDLK